MDNEEIITQESGNTSGETTTSGNTSGETTTSGNTSGETTTSGNTSGETTTTVEISTINHELNNYNYSEGIEFTPLIPSFIEKYGIETVGGSENSVEFFGANAKGNDALEVIDVTAAYADGESSGENQ